MIMRCYKVTVKTTDTLNRLCVQEIGKLCRTFYKCEEGVIYVITNDPCEIYKKFTPEAIKSIEDIGIGYTL